MVYIIQVHVLCLLQTPTLYSAFVSSSDSANEIHACSFPFFQHPESAFVSDFAPESLGPFCCPRPCRLLLPFPALFLLCWIPSQVSILKKPDELQKNSDSDGHMINRYPCCLYRKLLSDNTDVFRCQ